MVQACLAAHLFLATLVFTLSLSQVAYGQSLPKCVQPCILSLATDAECSENNFTCMCKIPLFGFTVQNCSRLYCSSKDQAMVEERIGQLCGTGEGNNTLEPTPSSSFEIFTFGGTFTPSGTTSSPASQGTKTSSPTLTTSTSTNVSKSSAPESGKSGDTISDSENTASPQQLKSGSSASSNHWAKNRSMLLASLMLSVSMIW